MGQILSNPVIDKEHHQGNDTFTAFGLCSMQGWRMSMEDAHIVELNVWEENESKEMNEVTKTGVDHLAMYGVFDGHGGSAVAKFCGQHLAAILKQQLVENRKCEIDNNFLVNAIKDTFLIADQRILTEQSMQNDHSGCTATCIVISKDTNNLICANAGDSRTVLATNGIAKALSFDHKPSLLNERSRIIAADGFVEMDRVNGNLALSRAIGDFEFKANDSLSAEEQVVTAQPDVLTHKINYSNDDFIILGCDGIWECLSSQECVNMVYRGILTPGLSLNDITSRIIDICCAPTTEGSGVGCDNMTIIIVALLQNDETEEEWFERIRNKKIEQNGLTSPTSKTHITTFEAMRRRVYNTFDFDDNNVFSVTTKSNDEKLVNENKIDSSTTTTEENDDHGQENNGELGSPQQPGYVLKFESLKQLLEAGVHVSTGPGSENSNNPTGPTHDSTILDILASLSEAAAGETAPFESDEEQEIREIREEHEGREQEQEHEQKE